MNIKIKPRTYYKKYYTSDWYDIYYTGNKLVYKIAETYINNSLIKYNKKRYWATIKNWQYCIKHQKFKVEEISKEDLFLELL